MKDDKIIIFLIILLFQMMFFIYVFKLHDPQYKISKAKFNYIKIENPGLYENNRFNDSSIYKGQR